MSLCISTAHVLTFYAAGVWEYPIGAKRHCDGSFRTSLAYRCTDNARLVGDHLASGSSRSDVSFHVRADGAFYGAIVA